jgi:hypothetical protein
MGKVRSRALRRKLAAILTAGVLFQSAQCTAGNEQLLQGLVQSIGGVLVTSFVNDLFGVTASPF